VKLETIPDENFFWTPLGKSYSCWEAEDQGPLKLFNVAADEVSVYIRLYASPTAAGRPRIRDHSSSSMWLQMRSVCTLDCTPVQKLL
jgi:hypothetical protein